MKPTFFIFLLSLFSFVSCIKNNSYVNRGLTGTVTGTISDSSGNFPVAGGTIMIIEIHPHCLLCFDGGSNTIASTVSDSQGNFTLSFKTTGHGADYLIECFSPLHYSGWGSGKVTPGKDTTIHFFVKKLRWMRVNVQMQTIPNPPLYVNSEYTTLIVSNFPADTTLYVEEAVNRLANMTFSYSFADSPYVMYDYHDTFLPPAGADPAFKNYVLDPSVFKRRP